MVFLISVFGIGVSVLLGMRKSWEMAVGFWGSYFTFTPFVMSVHAYMNIGRV
jgi:hypothetical protein